SCLGADSFGATFIELGFAYRFGIAPRTTLSAKLLGGFTDLSPGPVQSHGVVPDHVPGVHAGGGLALDYDTRLDHFAVGIDAVFRAASAECDCAPPPRRKGPAAGVRTRLRSAPGPARAHLPGCGRRPTRPPAIASAPVRQPSHRRREARTRTRSRRTW